MAISRKYYKLMLFQADMALFATCPAHVLWLIVRLLLSAQACAPTVHSMHCLPDRAPVCTDGFMSQNTAMQWPCKMGKP